MHYRELDPGPALRGAVACIWFLDHDAPAGAPPEKILPDGRAELVFNLGTPYCRIEAGAPVVQPRSFLVGQLRRFVEVVPRGAASIVGVRLEPPALHALLGTSLSSLTDRFVPLDELGHPELLELEARLHGARDGHARARVAVEVLEGLLAPMRPVRSATQHVLDRVRRHRGRLDLARLAASASWSLRTLDRRFASEVGLTPKTFARQVRLQHVFKLLARSPRPTWSEIALASGCCDQAHLNREFRAFAGESPAAFLRASHELSDRLTGLADASDRAS